MTFRRVCYLRIDHEPAGQPRAYPTNAGRFARMITDWRYRSGPKKGQYRPAWHFRQAVKAAAMLSAESSILSCPVKLSIRAFFPRPQRLLTRNSPDGPIPHIGVPDADNITKLVKDGINDAMIFWTDDRIVFDERCEKFYVSRHGRPGAGILIEALAVNPAFSFMPNTDLDGMTSE